MVVILTNKVQHNSQQVQQIIESYVQQVDIFELMLDELSKMRDTPNEFPPSHISQNKCIPFFGRLYKIIRMFLLKTKLYETIKNSNMFSKIAETGIFVKLGR